MRNGLVVAGLVLMVGGALFSDPPNTTAAGAVVIGVLLIGASILVPSKE